MITNSGDITPLSLWEIYEIAGVDAVTQELNLFPQSPSVIKYADAVESDDVSLDYNKRLHYLNEDLIAHFLKDEMWAELMRVYLKYLNDRIYQSVIDLHDMVFDEDWFTESFFDQYSEGLVARDILSLNVDDKEKVYKVSKFVSNLKGTKSSFSMMLGLLNQTMLFDKEQKRVFENTIVDIIEKRRYNEVDPQPNPKLFRAPFTYGYATKEEGFDDHLDVMQPIHPIGFNFVIDVNDSLDRQEILDDPEIDLTFRYLRLFRWNGVYQRTGVTEINNEGVYELRNYPILIRLDGEYENTFTMLDT